MNLTALNRATCNFERITSNCNADKATVIRWNMRDVMIMNLYELIIEWMYAYARAGNYVDFDVYEYYTYTVTGNRV